MTFDNQSSFTIQNKFLPTGRNHLVRFSCDVKTVLLLLLFKDSVDSSPSGKVKQVNRNEKILKSNRQVRSVRIYNRSLMKDTSRNHVSLHFYASSYFLIFLQTRLYLSDYYALNYLSHVIVFHVTRVLLNDIWDKNGRMVNSNLICLQEVDKFRLCEDEGYCLY